MSEGSFVYSWHLMVHPNAVHNGAMKITFDECVLDANYPSAMLSSADRIVFPGTIIGLQGDMYHLLDLPEELLQSKLDDLLGKSPPFFLYF